MELPPRLACEQCKRRKLRCDKGSPCSACKRAALSCHAVQRPRLPRGKTTKSRNNRKTLEARVARIEGLLEQQSEPHDSPTSHGKSTPSTGGPHAKAQDFVAPDFWTTLSEEVSGLRSALEDSEDEDDEATSTADLLAEHQHDPALNVGSIFFRTPRAPNSCILPRHSEEVRQKLLDLYHYRVDSVYKILHWPTVLRSVTAHNNGLDRTSVSTQALEHAIYFMALCSITDSEAVKFGMGVRSDLLRDYRGDVEYLLATSTLLHAPDLITLQALVIYLIGLRTCLNGAFTWTLVALAVRVGTALRLGDVTVNDCSAFDLELRRRLWFAIGILDMHSALDRGTLPLLPASAFKMPPLSINDCDMSAPSNVPVASSPNPTDMSHTTMIYEAMICQRKLIELSQNSRDWENWSMKLEILTLSERSMKSQCDRIVHPPSALEKLQEMSATKIAVSMHLLLRRPPYPQSRTTVPPWDDFNILEAATNVLEEHMKPMPTDLAPWAWKNWIQWHALAVVLAELLVCPAGPIYDRAYAIAVQSFATYARVIADGNTGMLWKPIARLMRRVHGLRQGQTLVHSPEAKVSSERSGDSSLTSDAVDPDLFGDLNVCELAQWDLNNNPVDSFVTDAQHLDRQPYESQQSFDSSWLAWDFFLQDLNFPAS